MELKCVIYEKKEGIATVTINRPEVRNALNRQTREELLQILQDLRTDKDIRVLILTGAGEKAFISGSDITQLKDLSPLQMQEFMATIGQQLYTDFENLEIPLIAKINGFCLGAGLELAMCCDFRVASENARFGQPEINLGILPGGGGTQRLARLIGIAKAKELIYTGDLIDAKEAEKVGLVNKVVTFDKLDEAVGDLARKIASKSPITIKLAKKAINKGMQASLDVGLAYEVGAQCLCFAAEDHTEGLNAFLEKRTPRFTGK